ncbi:hypothetical protein SRHO_G00187920 [Serrasalmus rhombeus]
MNTTYRPVTDKSPATSKTRRQAVIYARKRFIPHLWAEALSPRGSPKTKPGCSAAEAAWRGERGGRVGSPSSAVRSAEGRFELRANPLTDTDKNGGVLGGDGCWRPSRLLLSLWLRDELTERGGVDWRRGG